MTEFTFPQDNEAMDRKLEIYEILHLNACYLLMLFLMVLGNEVVNRSKVFLCDIVEPQQVVVTQVSSYFSFNNELA